MLEPLAAAVTQARSVEGPMPMRPCRISPDRYRTAISSSSAFSARRQSASRRILAERAEVVATCREVSTTVASRVIGTQRNGTGDAQQQARAEVALSAQWNTGDVPATPACPGQCTGAESRPRG